MKNVKNAIVWENGMVIVFDENGAQIPELQGPKEEMLEKIKSDYPNALIEYRSWEDLG